MTIILKITVLSLITLSSFAQFDKLKDKVKKELPAKEKEAPARGTGTSTPTDKDQQRTDRMNANAKSKEDAKYKSGELDRKTKLGSPEFDRRAYEERFYATFEPDFSTSNLSPAIAWFDLLDERLFAFDITKGELRLNGIHASFLPTKTKDGKEINYRPSLSVEMRPPIRADIVEVATGALKGQQYYKAEDYIPPFKKLNLVEEYGGDYFPFWVNVTEGSYEVRFFVGKSHFYTFPFKVEKKTNPDAYAAVKDFYFLHGPWEEWARIQFDEMDGQMTPSIYLTEQRADVKNHSNWDEFKPLQMVAKLTRNGSLVATFGVNPNTTHPTTNNGKWTRFQFLTYKAGTNQYFTKADLKDGNYILETNVKDPKTSKSSLSKYSFAVKEGMIQLHPKADRNQHKDPFTILEQGREFFYIKKM